MRTTDSFWDLAYRRQNYRHGRLNGHRIRLFFRRLGTCLFKKHHIFVTNKRLLQALEKGEVEGAKLHQRLTMLEKCFRNKETIQKIGNLRKRLENTPDKKRQINNESDPNQKAPARVDLRIPTLSQEGMDALLERCVRSDYETALYDHAYLEDLQRITLATELNLLTPRQLALFTDKIGAPLQVFLNENNLSIAFFLDGWAKKYKTSHLLARFLNISKKDDEEENRSIYQECVAKQDSLILYGLIKKGRLPEDVDLAQDDNLSSLPLRDFFVRYQKNLLFLNENIGNANLIELFKQTDRASCLVVEKALGKLAKRYRDEEFKSKAIPYLNSFLESIETKNVEDPEAVIKALTRIYLINKEHIKNEDLTRKILATLSNEIARWEKECPHHFSNKDLGYSLLELIKKEKIPMNFSPHLISEMSWEESFLYGFIRFQMTENDSRFIDKLRNILKSINENRFQFILKSFATEDASEEKFRESLHIIHAQRFYQFFEKEAFLELSPDLQKEILALFSRDFPKSLTVLTEDELKVISSSMQKIECSKKILSHITKIYENAEIDKIETLINDLFSLSNNFSFGLEIIDKVLLTKLPQTSLLFAEQKEIGCEILKYYLKKKPTNADVVFSTFFAFRFDFLDFEKLQKNHVLDEFQDTTRGGGFFNSPLTKKIIDSSFSELKTHHTYPTIEETCQLIKWFELYCTKKAEYTSALDEDTIQKLMTYLDAVLTKPASPKSLSFINLSLQILRDNSGCVPFQNNKKQIKEKLRAFFYELAPAEGGQKTDELFDQHTYNLYSFFDNYYRIFADLFLEDPKGSGEWSKSFAQALFIGIPFIQGGRKNTSNFGLPFTDAHELMENAVQSAKNAYEYGLPTKYYPYLNYFLKKLEPDPSGFAGLEKLNKFINGHLLNQRVENEFLPKFLQNINSLSSDEVMDLMRWAQENGREKEILEAYTYQSPGASVFQLEKQIWTLIETRYDDPQFKTEILVLLTNQLPENSWWLENTAFGTAILAQMDKSSHWKEKYVKIVTRIRWSSEDFKERVFFPSDFFSEVAERDSLRSLLADLKNQGAMQGREETFRLITDTMLQQRIEAYSDDPTDDNLLLDILEVSKQGLDEAERIPIDSLLKQLFTYSKFLFTHFKDSDQMEILGRKFIERRADIERLLAKKLAIDPSSIKDLIVQYGGLYRIFSELSVIKRPLFEKARAEDPDRIKDFLSACLGSYLLLARVSDSSLTHETIVEAFLKFHECSLNNNNETHLTLLAQWFEKALEDYNFLTHPIISEIFYQTISQLPEDSLVFESKSLGKMMLFSLNCYTKNCWKEKYLKTFVRFGLRPEDFKKQEAFEDSFFSEVSDRNSLRSLLADLKNQGAIQGREETFRLITDTMLQQRIEAYSHAPKDDNLLLDILEVCKQRLDEAETIPIASLLTQVKIYSHFVFTHFKDSDEMKILGRKFIEKRADIEQLLAKELAIDPSSINDLIGRYGSLYQIYSQLPGIKEPLFEKSRGKDPDRIKDFLWACLASDLLSAHVWHSTFTNENIVGAFLKFHECSSNSKNETHLTLLAQWFENALEAHTPRKSTMSNILYQTISRLPEDSVLFENKSLGKNMLLLLRDLAETGWKENYLKIFVRFGLRPEDFKQQEAFEDTFFSEVSDRNSLCSLLADLKNQRAMQGREETFRLITDTMLEQRIKAYHAGSCDVKLWTDIVAASTLWLDEVESAPISFLLEKLNRYFEFLKKNSLLLEDSSKALGKKVLEKRTALEQRLSQVYESDPDNFWYVSTAFIVLFYFFHDWPDANASLLPEPANHEADRVKTFLWIYQSAFYFANGVNNATLTAEKIAEAFVSFHENGLDKNNLIDVNLLYYLIKKILTEKFDDNSIKLKFLSELFRKLPANSPLFLDKNLGVVFLLSFRKETLDDKRQFYLELFLKFRFLFDDWPTPFPNPFFFGNSESDALNKFIAEMKNQPQETNNKETLSLITFAMAKEKYPTFNPNTDRQLFNDIKCETTHLLDAFDDHSPMHLTQSLVVYFEIFHEFYPDEESVKKLADKLAEKRIDFEKLFSKIAKQNPTEFSTLLVNYSDLCAIQQGLRPTQCLLQEPDQSETDPIKPLIWATIGYNHLASNFTASNFTEETIFQALEQSLKNKLDKSLHPYMKPICTYIMTNTKDANLKKQIKTFSENFKH